MPTTVPAARMPNESSASCTRPKTSLDAPAIICPDASSTVPVVSTPPGRNVASGAISRRIGSPTSKYGAMRNTASAHANDAKTGKTSWSVRDGTSFARPMKAPSTNATSAPCQVGMSRNARPVVRSAWPKVRTNQP